MHDFSILKEKGCDENRLREIFTCKEKDKPEWEIRQKLEDEIEARIYKGVQHSLDNGRKYQIVDWAWDSTPIQKEIIPLMLYAQGKIDLQECVEDLSELNTTNLYCDTKGNKKIKDLSQVRLYETPLDIMRSYVTIRHAAQCDRYDVYPYLKNEPLGTTPEAKLRADALTQRMEIMVNQFGLKHTINQSIREMLLYSHSLLFPTCPWKVEYGWRKAKQNPDLQDKDKDEGLESPVEREGLNFVSPHPIRTFWDKSLPLANVNYDNGPQWLGYWDIVRYKDIMNDDNYWNREDIAYTSSLIELADQNRELLTQHYSPTAISWPDVSSNYMVENERKKISGRYTKNDLDKTVYLTNYLTKINPREYGIGEYDRPIWVRFIVAGDRTVVGGDFMPSLPAIYMGYNEHDGRAMNKSFAQEVLQFQDHLSNILSHLLMSLKISLLKIACIDKDILEDEHIQYIKDQLQSKDFYSLPLSVFYSGSKMRDSGINDRDFIKIIKADMQVDINNAFQAIDRLLNITDRLFLISPNEAAQVSPREITAHEVTQIANTTNTIYNFISSGIDEARAALKKMIYESMLTLSEEPLRVPVLGRYPPSVVKKSGFKPEGAIEENDDDHTRRMVIVGKPENLRFYYNFNTRDGANRTHGTQISETLTRLFQIVGQPEWVEQIGKPKLYELLNEIVRNAGGAFDLGLDAGAEMEPTEQAIKMAQQIPQLMQIMKIQSQRLGALEQSIGGGTQQPQAQPQQPPMGQ